MTAQFRLISFVVIGALISFARPATAQGGYWDVRVETKKICAYVPGQMQMRYDPDPGFIVKVTDAFGATLSSTTALVDPGTAVASLRVPRNSTIAYLVQFSSPASPAARIKQITRNDKLETADATNASAIWFDAPDGKINIVVYLDDGDCEARQCDPQASREFRDNMLPVLRHPRCANCHGAMDLFAKDSPHPGGSFAGREEGLTENKWVACAQCHDLSPKDPAQSTKANQWRVVLTDAPRWGVLSDHKLCSRLKETAQTSGEFLAHMQNDFRVKLGFAGTRGQKDLDAEPPPRTQAQFVESATRWIDTMRSENWHNSECGCDGLSDSPPPPPPRSDCGAAVSRVQNAVNAEAEAKASAMQTTCQLKSMSAESRAGKPQAIADSAQKIFDKALKETSAAYAAARDCDTSSVKRPTVSSGASNDNLNAYWTCVHKNKIDQLQESMFSPATPRDCAGLLDELNCEGIKVVRDEPPPVIGDDTIKVPDDIKPECRQAYVSNKAAEQEAERARKNLEDISKTYAQAGPRGYEMYKAAIARRQKASEEKDRAYADLSACEAKAASQTEQRGAAGPPAGDQPKAWEPDTMRAGPDIEVLPMDRMDKADAMQCKLLCQRWGGCNAFTYVDPAATSDGKPLCQLKSAVGPATRDPCCVSGLP